MKKLIFTFAFLITAAAQANSKTLYGYVNLSKQNDPYFVSVDTSSGELTAVLPWGFFDDKQLEIMDNCMDMKTTHAIKVISTPATQYNVPTDIPGQTTATHFPEYEVSCISAPGFLESWREVVRSSSFH